MWGSNPIGTRRFRALVSWLPPDSAIARLALEEAEEHRAPDPPTPKPTGVVDLAAMRRFAEAHPLKGGAR